MEMAGLTFTGIDMRTLRGHHHAWAYLRATFRDFDVPVRTFEKWCDSLLIPYAFQAAPKKMRHYKSDALDKWWKERQN